MFKIGEFSRFSRVSVKMLRHYDEIGLLRPQRVDAATGYRYYSADQLPRLNRIIALKDLDFRLDEIARLLDDDLSADEFRGVLKAKRAEIAARIAADQARLGRIEQLMTGERLHAYPVVLRRVDDQRIASIRATIRPDEAVSDLFDTLERHVANHNARQTAPPLMLLLNDEYHDNRNDVEVAVPISRDLPETDAIKLRDLPGGKMACIVYTGAYQGLGSIMGRFLPWLAAHNHRPVGSLREVYLRFGADGEGYTLPDAYLTTGAEGFVTEVQLPVEPQV